MFRKLYLLISVIFLFNSVYSQNTFSKVDDWLHTHTSEMGGRSYLIVYKDGKIVYSNGFNTMTLTQKWFAKKVSEKQGSDVGDNDFTADTKLSIASCSKWLSAALVMTFIDEGKLQLDDTVGKFLPILTEHNKGNITISECLSHLTGIEAPPIRESISGTRKLHSMNEVVQEISNMPMEGKPGTVFHYSNVGLQIAGAVIEKISGEDFEKLFEERMAKPLEMTNTNFDNGSVVVPAGSAKSSVTDYLHFLEMILNKGVYNGKRILSEKSIEQMQINRIDKNVKIAYSPDEAKDFGYGFGEWVMESLNNISTAVTSPGLFGSFPWVDSQNNYCAFLMTFYLKNEGRHTRYTTLKSLVDEAVKNIK